MVRFSVIKNNEFQTIEIKDLNTSSIKPFLSDERMIYIVDCNRLIGMIGPTEKDAISRNGVINVNKKGTAITESQTDDKLALELFSQHTNWKGIPVIGKNGEIVYEYKYDIRKYYDEIDIPDNSGINHEYRRNRVVISITTHDERLSTVYLALKSLMCQTIKADEIILYLAKGSGDGELEREDELKRAGVRVVRGVDDIKCHKKYYYSMLENKNDIIITADDDCIYDDCFIEDLLSKHEEFKDAVICNYGDRIAYDGDKVKSYILWDDSTPSVIPESQICIKSYAGVLYPVGDYRKEFLKREIFEKLSEYNDDLWITACLQECGIKVYSIGAFRAHIIAETQGTALWNEDNTVARNDIYVDRLKKHFRKAYRKYENIN